tara:strand:- start:6 stop:1256 length:1251 start_codon:yes stop_codon:yes gene_type:complete
MGDSGGPSESQVGDDPATFDDEGVGYGNISTTTEQALSVDPSIDDDFSAADAAAARAEIQNQQGTTINVPSVQAADTTNIFTPDEIRATMDTPSQTMVEALGTPSMMPANVTRETVVDNTPLGLARSMLQDVQGLKGTTSGLLDAINFGTGTGRDIDTETPTRSLDPRGIDFGVTDTALRVRTPGTQTTDQILADQSRMQQGQIPSTGDAQFGVSPGRLQAEFGPRVASLAGGLDEQKTADIADLTNRPGIGTLLGLPSFARGAANFIGQKSRDRMAEAIARGRTDPLFGKGTDITDANLIRNEQGQVVGIRDNQGNLIEGMDPNAQMQESDSENIKKAQPKAPTDPCPEGYQLIDGKCTLIEKPVDEGTGFIRFPTDRTPPFETGPFTPKTVATNPISITPLNPVTFRLSDIFKT